MMRSKRFFVLCASVLAAVSLAVGASFAQDEHQHDSKDQAQGEYSPEMMQAWQAAMTPGEHHMAMKEFVGKWNAEVKSWNAPGTEPTVSEGTCEYKMVLGDRYLMQTFDGNMMGMPFSGIGLNGYDNVAKKHTSMWMDNMGTAMMYAEGTCSDHCKKVEETSTIKDPMSGQDMNLRMVTTVVSKDKHVFDYYVVGPDGKEFEMMQITYTRM